MTFKKSVVCNNDFLSNDSNTDHNKEGKSQHSQTFDPQHAFHLGECNFFTAV